MTENQRVVIDGITDYFPKADHSGLLKIWNAVKDFYVGGIKEFIRMIKETPTLAEDINRVVAQNKLDRKEIDEGEIAGVVKGFYGGESATDRRSDRYDPTVGSPEAERTLSSAGQRNPIRSFVTEDPTKGEVATPPAPKSFIAGEEKETETLTSFATAGEEVVRGWQPADSRTFDEKTGEIQARVAQALGKTEWKDVRELLGEQAIDGYYGDKTRSAVKNWQAKEGFEPTGDLTSSQYRKLQKETDVDVYFDGEKFASVRWGKK